MRFAIVARDSPAPALQRRTSAGCAERLHAGLAPTQGSDVAVIRARAPSPLRGPGSAESARSARTRCSDLCALSASHAPEAGSASYGKNTFQHASAMQKSFIEPGERGNPITADVLGNRHGTTEIGTTRGTKAPFCITSGHPIQQASRGGARTVAVRRLSARQPAVLHSNFRHSGNRRFDRPPHETNKKGTF